MDAVDAQVIERSEVSIAVEYVPATISDRLAEVSKAVDAILEPYIGATYDLTDDRMVRLAKGDSSYLNKLKNEIEDERKAIKKRYNEPYAEFERRVKLITGRIDAVRDTIKAQVDEAERRRRAARLDMLRETYSDFAGPLEDAVPYERFHDDKWLLKSTNEMSARDQLMEKVSSAVRSWSSLELQRETLGTYYDVAERTFFETLDFERAFCEADKARRRDEEIARLREEVGRPKPEAMPATATDSQVRDQVPDASDGGPRLRYSVEIYGSQSAIERYLRASDGMGVCISVTSIYREG